MIKNCITRLSFIFVVVGAAFVFAPTSVGLVTSASAEEEAALFTYNFLPVGEYTTASRKGSMEITDSGGNETITKISFLGAGIGFEIEPASQKKCEQGYVNGTKCTVNINFTALAACPKMQYTESVRVTYKTLIAYEHTIKGLA